MPTIEVRRPHLYPLQEQAIYCDERIAVIEASTKSGKTFGCMAWILEGTLAGRSGQNYWWVAPVYPQARMVYRRIARQLVRQLPAGAFRLNESELTIGFPDHGILFFKSADNPDNLYGEDVYAAVVDEATRCKEEAWHAVRSTLTATRGPIRIIGNVKGRRNWAYHLARRAQAGERDMRYTKITAQDAVDAGVLDEEEIEDARRTLPETVFRELYLAEASDDGGNPFGLSAIGASVAPLAALPPGHPKVWGVDLAKSVDWTVAIALDAQNRVCGFERWQGPWPETVSRLAHLIGRDRALVDSTGAGDPVLAHLQKQIPHAEGFHFSASSKQQLMEGLAVAIQQGQVAFPAGPIVAELEAFEYEYTRTGARYAAPTGMHDDCVCALALAVQHNKRSVITGNRYVAGPSRSVLDPMNNPYLQGHERNRII